MKPPELPLDLGRCPPARPGTGSLVGSGSDEAFKAAYLLSDGVFWKLRYAGADCQTRKARLDPRRT